MYVYVKETPKEWIKIKSKKYCQKHLFSLLGVNNIDELKLVIAKCRPDMNFRYPSSFDIPPTILYYIKIEEIGYYN